MDLLAKSFATTSVYGGIAAFLMVTVLRGSREWTRRKDLPSFL